MDDRPERPTKALLRTAPTPTLEWRIQARPDGMVKLTSGDFVVVAYDDGEDLTAVDADAWAAQP